MKYLVKMSADWADEFQCEQFKLFTSLEEAEKRVAHLESIKGEVYFGTNESFEGEELMGAFEIVEITEQEAAAILRTLGNKFGTGVL